MKILKDRNSFSKIKEAIVQIAALVKRRRIRDIVETLVYRQVTKRKKEGWSTQLRQWALVHQLRRTGRLLILQLLTVKMNDIFK